jgi:hypothetical protein
LCLDTSAEKIVGGSGDFPHCELFNQCHAARSNVPNSAGVDQCQSLKRQGRLDRPSIALAHFEKTPGAVSDGGKSNDTLLAIQD